MNGAGRAGDLREGSGAGRQGDPNVFDGSGRDGSKPPQEKFEEGGEGNGGSATLSMCPNCHTKHIVGQSCPTFPVPQQEEYMKKTDLGQYFLWRGKIARIISSVENKKVIGIEMVEPDKCPECGHDLGKKQFDVVESSPLFQENSKPIETIKENL